MAFWQIAFMIIITLVVAEFGLHVCFHAKTGRAGLNDSAFGYLGEVREDISEKLKAESSSCVRKVRVTVENRATYRPAQAGSHI